MLKLYVRGLWSTLNIPKVNQIVLLYPIHPTLWSGVSMYFSGWPQLTIVHMTLLHWYVIHGLKVWMAHVKTVPITEILDNVTAQSSMNWVHTHCLPNDPMLIYTNRLQHVHKYT